MRHLLLLIRKDWMYFMAVNHIFFFLSILVWIPFMLFHPASTPLLFVVTTYVFVLALFQIEENDLVCNVRAILPVRKRDIVLARYLYAYMVVAAQMLVFGVIQLLAQQKRAPSEWFIPLLVALCASLLILSITMPLAYRFGYMKARILITVVYILLVIVTSVLQPFFHRLLNGQDTSLFPSTGIWPAISGAFVSTGFWLTACGTFFLLSLVSMAVSMRIAR